MLLFYLAAWSVRAWPIEGPWPVLAVVYLPGFLFLSGPIAGAVVALVFRSPKIGWLSLLLLAVTVGPLMGFRWGGEKGEMASLRVVTVNVGSWKSNLNKVGHGLADLNADVILLQEVWAKGHLEQIQGALDGYLFVSGEPPETEHAKHYSMSLFVATKLPVVDQQNSREGCVQMVTVEGKGRRLVVANLHGLKQFGFRPVDLEATVSEQQRQGETILKLLKSYSVPALVGGDFNAPLGTPLAQYLLSGRAEAYDTAGVGYGYTYPAAFPILKIDHLMSPSELRPLRAWTVDVGSDHRALVADYRWAP